VRFKNESFIYHASLTLQWTPFATCGFNFRMRKYAQRGPRLTNCQGHARLIESLELKQLKEFEL